MKERWESMYKYNLKLNPELAAERHREQNRAWYQRNKAKVMEAHRKYRARKRGETCTITWTTEVHPMPDEKEFERLGKILKQHGGIK